MKILFIRHGETETNTQGLTHRTDDSADLTIRGTSQIHAVANICRQHSITSLYSSPERRCITSSIIVQHQLSLHATIINELRERNWGAWEGRPWKDIASELNRMDITERYTFIPPQGESWQQMEQRLRNAMNRITSHTAGNVMVITHGGALRALIPLLERAPREKSFNYDFANGSITIYSYEHDLYTPIVINDVSHLASLL